MGGATYEVPRYLRTLPTYLIYVPAKCLGLLPHQAEKLSTDRLQVGEVSHEFGGFKSRFLRWLDIALIHVRCCTTILVNQPTVIYLRYTKYVAK